MVAWYSKSIICSSSVSFFHWHPWQSAWCRDQISCCLQFVLSEVCQIRVSEMPKWSWLFEALLESVHTWSTFLRSWTVSSRVSQWLYASSPPATSMKAHCLSSGIWSATKITFIRRLKSFHAATLSAALQFISGYFSLGTDGMISAIRRSFQDHKGNWMRYISATNGDSNLTFGMQWGGLRQCPLVMAYRGRTDRNWIIEVTMCCPERTK